MITSWATKSFHALTGLLLFTTALTAQSTDTLNAFQRAQIARRIPVRIALVNGSQLLPATARIQRNRAAGSDVVFVRKADASPQLLSEALFTLMLMQEEKGDTAAFATTVTVREGSIPQNLTHSTFGIARNLLTRVATSPQISVPGVGSALQMATIYLPNKALRLARKSEGRLVLKRGRPNQRP